MHQVRFETPVTIWNTVYLDAAIEQLRTDGYPVGGEDVARLSPYVRAHINVHGHYSFQLPTSTGDARCATPTTPTRRTDPACPCTTAADREFVIEIDP